MRPCGLTRNKAAD
ncbi:hypothetical protein S40285_10753, partial [Stachybotrys chlorohalonatus IBT 40285]